MLRLFRNALENSADFLRLEKNVREGVTPISVFGVSDGQKTHLATALTQDRPVLFVTQGISSAENVKNDFEFYTGKKAVIFPGLQYVVDAKYQSTDVQNKRIHALNECLNGAQAVIVPFDAIMFNIAPPKMLENLKIFIEAGKTYSIEELRKKLVLCGYKSVTEINAAGEFFIHGGIIDIFPLNSENSVRIDFFDNEVETIRLVEPVSQRSVERIKSIEILPISETCATEEDLLKASQLLLDEVLKFNKSSKNKDAITHATDTFVPMAQK